MKVIDFYENLIDLDETSQEAVKVFKRGGVVIYPTDTIYGIGCDARSEAGLAQIIKIKAREKNKAFSVIMKDLAMIKEYAQVDARGEKIIKKLLPGKFTLIFKDQGKLPDEVTGSSGGVGVRIPDHPLTRKISGKLAAPYVTTSVNLSGEAPEIWGVDIISKFQEESLKPELIINAGKLADDNDEPIASTVIDLTQKQIRILRTGGLSVKEVMDILTVV